MVKFSFQEAPDEIIDSLKNKGLKLSFNYKELQKEAHDKAFTVAKVTRMDLLNDIHSSLVSAFKSGENFESWKKNIIPTLEKKGWWGEQEITNPKTGEVKKVNIDSRRLKTIYSTNMRVSYQKYRYQQMMELPLSTYWMYRSALLETTRTSHRLLHGTVLPRDHIFWSKNYPPNDWNCKCTVTAHSKRELERMGIFDKVVTGDIDNIASLDWDYNVGVNTNLAGIKKLDLDESLKDLPLVSSVKNEALKDMTENGLKERFYKTLGITAGNLFIDKTNDPIVITDDFFQSKNTAKILKNNRNYFITELAETLKEPDEIYLEFESLRDPNDKYIDVDSRLVKKYLKYYKTEAGAKRALMVLVEYLKDKTTGVSAYFITNTGTVENKRVEKLIYKKD